MLSDTSESSRPTVPLLDALLFLSRISPLKILQHMFVTIFQLLYGRAQNFEVVTKLSRSVTFPRQNDVNVRLRNVVGNNNTSIVVYTEFIKFCINPSSPLFNTLLFYSWIQNDKPFDKSNRCKILLRSDHIMILVAN